MYKFFWNRFPLLALVVGWSASFIPWQSTLANEWPADVEAALVKAGDNRVQLERVLKHYRTGNDPQKFAAACFLIRNMPGQAYGETVFKNSKGEVLPFNLTDYKSRAEAMAALQKLAAQHGQIGLAPHRFIPDEQFVSGDYLIGNIELAFAAWREKPWARQLSFEAFCEYVLPYRGSEEPVESWRAACLLDTEAVLAEVKEPSDVFQAAAAVRKLTPFKVDFNELYYLQPTDQGFRELCRKPVGRCEDQTNMQLYILRANAIPAASDGVPFWANYDGNHAWEVVLDQEGRGKGPLFHKAAKIYRRTFSRQADSLAAIRKENEPIPPTLASPWQRDVTDQYLETANVTLTLDPPPPANTRFAYLCVFNSNNWQPIAWTKIEAGKATFQNMGPDVVYLPVYYTSSGLAPAGAPFILHPNGATTQLALNRQAIEAFLLDPPKNAAEEIADPPPVNEMANNREAPPEHILLAWDRGWKPIAKHAGDNLNEAWLKKLPEQTLYWLVNPQQPTQQRVFTVESGAKKSW